jgi:hypothetical protein
MERFSTIDSQALRHHVVAATPEIRQFSVGDRLRVLLRSPLGHYRVPAYLRGKIGRVVDIIEPRFVDNEAEGFGRNAGIRGYYYLLAFFMSDVWSQYRGPARDELRIEVFQNWLINAEGREDLR